MTDPGESRYGNELMSWPGFASVESIRNTLSDQDIGAGLEQQLPGVTGRLTYLLDMVSLVREVPPHTMPVEALTNIGNHLQSIVQYLPQVPSNPSYAQQVEAQTNAALIYLIPVLGSVQEKDYTTVIESVREEARGAMHGLRTSAGRLDSDLATLAEQLKSAHDEHRTTLAESSATTRETLVQEAASMRERTEASVTEARTNAEAHFQAMRTEVDAIRERADAAYKTALEKFEVEKSAAEESREQLQESFEGQVTAWSEAVVNARQLIETEIESGKSRLDEVVDWADSVRGDIQIAALAAGFAEARRRYQVRAWIALGVALLFTLATVVLSIAFFSTLWNVDPAATNSELVRQVGLRIGAIALPLAAAVFAARIYRTNSHLEAVNSERAQAAKAFEGFAARAATEESKDAMLVILAQLVFAGRDTGHHTEEQIMPIDVAALIKQVTGRR